MSTLLHVEDELQRAQDEIDRLSERAYLLQQRINAKAVDMIVLHIADQAERIHELLNHAGSLDGCFQPDCIDSKRMLAAIKKAAGDAR